MKRGKRRKRAENGEIKRVYLRLALIAIGAGLVYLLLPLPNRNPQGESSQESRKESDPGTNQGKAVFGPEEKIYRIGSGTLDTEKGQYALKEPVTLWVNGEKSEEAAGNFLSGKKAALTLDEQGAVTDIAIRGQIETPEKVRVLLSSGENAYEHGQLTLSCDGNFWALWDGEIITYPAGSKVTVAWKEGKISRRACFYAASEKALFTVVSDGAGTHSYYGSLEIFSGEAGFCLINEVDTETYLCGVVPSEMPESYGLEAAKAQAVCARSYVCSQWKKSVKYAAWGAHVDNTVNSQCYGGAVEKETARQAVEETWGQVLTFQEEIIPANYFSTSCGWTAAAADVWKGKEDMTYLSSRPQYTEGEYGDLSREEDFHAFITDTQVKAYDQSSRWFRWTARIRCDQVREGLEAWLAEAGPVKVLEGEFFEEKELKSVGEVEDFYVYTRAESGLATSMLIVGTEASVKVEGAQTIRKILAAADITLSNGEKIGQRSLLPSAFISLEKIKDASGKLTSVKICGGGYGHGAGLSQTGVKGMTELGYTYQEILAHYYEGTELTDLP